MSKRFEIAGIISALLIVVLMMTLTGCYSKSGGENYQGEYQAVETGEGDEYVGGYWHLSITEDDGGYLSIYDNEAGNPGIEGPIDSIDDKSIKVKYDPDYYDELPSARWKTDGEYLIVEYEKTDNGIKLTNNGYTIAFNKCE